MRRRLEDVYFEALERFGRVMPYFIARLIGLLPCIAHFQPFVLVLLLVASLMGMLIPLLLYRLPLAKSIPAILLQLGLLGLIFWQWLHAWTLRQRVEELEDELDWLTA